MAWLCLETADAYVDGKELKDLMGFVIFRKDISPLRGLPGSYRPLTTVDVEIEKNLSNKSNTVCG